MKANYEFVVNAERNGFEVHFKAYNKAAWSCLIKNYKMLPMAKKSFVYATPKRMTEAEFCRAYENIARCLEFTPEERKAFDKQFKKICKAAYPKPKTKTNKSTKSRTTAKAVVLPQVAEDLYDIFR